MRFEFSAVYQIKSAKRTTIAQLLNTDDGKSDKRAPVLFLVAWKSGGSVQVCSFEACFTSWPNLPTRFRVTITTSGKRAKVVINGRSPKYFNLHRPRNGRVRTRGYHYMRCRRHFNLLIRFLIFVVQVNINLTHYKFF